MDLSKRRDRVWHEGKYYEVEVIDGRRVIPSYKRKLVWEQNEEEYPLSEHGTRGNGICHQCRGSGTGRPWNSQILGFDCYPCKNTGVCGHCHGAGFDVFGAPCSECANHIPAGADWTRKLRRLSYPDIEDG